MNLLTNSSVCTPERHLKHHVNLISITITTVAHNCHIKTKCSQQITNRSQQIQISHSKFKSLTANSNLSQQIQVAHSKFKSLTANYKLHTANYKSITANFKLLTAIQVAHSKFNRVYLFVEGRGYFFEC